ncbi:MAG: lectin [Acidobacteriota bacterium]
MKNLRAVLIALSVALVLGSYIAVAQQAPAPAGGAPQGRAGGAPPQPMSFFITSVGKGDGANYGGLTGADAYCQTMGAAAGRGAPVVWHAYLSTQGAGAVNARDRIGSGPWYNARGGLVARGLADLHGDTIEQARIGNALGKQISLSEKNTVVNGVGDMPNQHDILTGSQTDGRAYTDAADHTCSNYTANTNVEAPARGAAGAPAAPAAPGPSVQLGHHDKQGGGNGSWNSTHASRGCSQPNLVATGGAGLLYCFAVGQ